MLQQRSNQQAHVDRLCKYARSELSRLYLRAGLIKSQIPALEISREKELFGSDHKKHVHTRYLSRGGVDELYY